MPHKRTDRATKDQALLSGRENKASGFPCERKAAVPGD